MQGDGADVLDGRAVDGRHCRSEGPVQGVVEDRRADVGHDGVKQRLAQILLLGGYRGGRGRRLIGQGQSYWDTTWLTALSNSHTPSNPDELLEINMH